MSTELMAPPSGKAIHMLRTRRFSGRIARGLIAGATGTAVFDLWLYGRYRQKGGESSFTDWETSAGLSSWEDAPAPALVGKRLIERITGQELERTHVRLVNN